VLAFFAAFLCRDESWPGLLPVDARMVALFVAGAFFVLTVAFSAAE
jgi:hypothetical protein